MGTAVVTRPLGVQEAYEALDDFARRAGRVPLLLLLHASVPPSFRADLLNLLKLNFLGTEAGTDLTIDADVLLSTLVHRAAAGYYRLDPEVRRHALALLDAEYRAQPERRTAQVARFLLAYADAKEREATLSLDAMFAEYLAVQRWVALAFLDPAATAEAFAAAIAEGLEKRSTVARLRLGSVSAAISIPLTGHQELLAYARGVDALVTGDVPTANRWRQYSGDQELRIGRVTLRPAKTLLGQASSSSTDTRPPTGDVRSLRTACLSSTLEDLRPEREAVISILGTGFSVRSSYESGSTEPSTRDLDECDLFVGIVGLRYGFIPAGETKSLTQLEFEAAGAKGIQRLMFIKDESSIPFTLTDAKSSPDGIQRVLQFRDQIQNSGGATAFRTVDELREQVESALAHLRDQSRSQEVEQELPQPEARDAEPAPAPSGQADKQPLSAPDYTCDIYVSYAHVDNVELSEGRRGWVSNLVRALERRLNQLGGRNIKIEFDPKVAGNDVFDESLSEQIRGAATFVSVLSPRYVRSEWTRRELTMFVESHRDLSLGDRSRMFKIVKTPVALDLHPPELRPLLGYEFFKTDPESGKVREFDESFGPDAQRDFWLRLDDLAHDIAEVLEKLPPSRSEESAAPPR